MLKTIAGWWRGRLIPNVDLISEYLNSVLHHFQQLLRVLHRFLTVRDAELLVEVANMRLNGGCRYRSSPAVRCCNQNR